MDLGPCSPPIARHVRALWVQPTTEIQMKAYFIAYGKVMGSCGHRHRTEATAQRCIESTARAIARSPYYGPGAYCDRRVLKIENA